MKDPQSPTGWKLEKGGQHLLGPLPGAGEGYAGGVSSLEFVDDDRLVSGGTNGVLLFDRRQAGHRQLSSRPGRAVAVDRRHGVVFALLREPDEIVRLGLDGREPTKVASSVGCYSLAVDRTGTMVATGRANGIVRIGPASGGEPHLLEERRVG